VFPQVRGGARTYWAPRSGNYVAKAAMISLPPGVGPSGRIDGLKGTSNNAAVPGDMGAGTGHGRGLILAIEAAGGHLWLNLLRFTLLETHFSCRLRSCGRTSGVESVELDRPAHVVGQVLEADPGLGTDDPDAAQRRSCR